MLNYKVEGLEHLLNKTNGDLLKKPLRDFFNRATITLEGKARENAPSDVGLMRNEISAQVDSSEFPLFGKVGFLGAREGSTEWLRARAMEYGTGSAGDASVSHKSGHFPPWGDQNPGLDTWAQRHGFENSFIVARAIARQGGLKARLFLRKALRDSKASIKEFMQRAEREIKGAWDTK